MDCGEKREEGRDDVGMPDELGDCGVPLYVGSGVAVETVLDDAGDAEDVGSAVAVKGGNVATGLGL